MSDNESRAAATSELSAGLGEPRNDMDDDYDDSGEDDCFDECGAYGDGTAVEQWERCQLAGSEHCDWDCKFASMVRAKLYPTPNV
ncbi:hypothetical protein [Methylobacillus flagellatus]|uniref:hypothetical protein n=1 Tax=Methylobacillus flagellatus TaxID=405 RepID=UPI0010F84D10|nr:hypothetical protein [Methylobacillus flagellatus]